MLSKKLVLMGFCLSLTQIQPLCAAESFVDLENEDPYVAVGQPSRISKIDPERVERARVSSDRLIAIYRVCRIGLGGVAAGSIGLFLYNFLKPLPSATAPVAGISAAASLVSAGAGAAPTQTSTQISGLSEEEFRKKVSERLTELEAHFAPLQTQEQRAWWHRVLLSYFEQVKVLSWAALYYVVQMATSSFIVAAIDRVVPLSELGVSTPSLTWFITNKTSFVHYLQDSVGCLKAGFEDDADYAVFCDSVSMFVHEIEQIMGYVESYAVLAGKDDEVKNFLQDTIKKLHSATDEFVDAVLGRDAKRALVALARLQRLVNNLKVICAG